MEIRKEILQKFIEENGEYLIGQRYVKGYRNNDDEWQTFFLSPSVDAKLWNKKIGELPFDIVNDFADKDILTNISLGDLYPPFQYGIRYKDFIALEKVTCKPNELINKCYAEKITDYYKVLELMKELQDGETTRKNPL